MTTIKAPYNFVPLNTDVVSPHWIDSISHDIPFSDGQSGVIEFKLTAQTEIFVRDGIGQKQAKDNYLNGVQQKPHQFSNYQYKYFIPGSSIKGMVRNVLEIMSFGGMASKVNNHRYALRDLSGAMKDAYLKDFRPDKIHCGWLKKEQDNSYTLIDCGLPGRISHREIDRKWGTEISRYFSVGGKFNSSNDFEKSAQKKYELFGTNTTNGRFSFSAEDAGRQIYTKENNGTKDGILVFTGQPGVRKQQDNDRWTGHHLEFIFFSSTKEIKVPEYVIENFLFAYFEHDKPKWSKDWQVWRQKLAKGDQIPVFFHKDDEGCIKSLGLSYLYKLPYNYSVVDIITKNQKEEKPDLSDAIFGYVLKNKALKGRVQIGHAFAKDAKCADEKTEVLSSPKASYYPTYIRQKVNNNNCRVVSYKTFMDGDAQIAGWKRYPVHHYGVKNNNGDGDKIKTKFIPLKEGAEFIGRIHFHNLRKVELGALLSALTFHGTADTYHSIGMAKPLGYGKVKLDITKVENIERESLSLSEYLCAFEAYMNVQLDKKKQPWHKQDQVVELVTMAQDTENADLSYMNLKEHIKVKANKEGKEGLAKYSIIVGKEASINSYCNESEIQQVKEQIIREEKTMQHTENIDSVVIACREIAQKAILEKWEFFKNSLLSDLEQKRRQIEEKENEDKAQEEAKLRDIKKEQQAESAWKNGPDFMVEINRDAWDRLKNSIDSWGKKAHKSNNIDAILNSNPMGFVPLEFHESLFEVLKKIFDSQNAKMKRRWLDEAKNNVYRIKITQWVGSDKANEFFEILKSN